MWKNIKAMKLFTMFILLLNFDNPSVSFRDTVVMTSTATSVVVRSIFNQENKNHEYKYNIETKKS